MIVVSDSTTLIILSDLHKLTYLTNIFDEILLPKAVFEEISHKKPPLLSANFKVVDGVKDETFETLCRLLDLGESEAIALAKEKNLPLIIDEKKGRKIAQNMGLKIIGLLGVLYINIKKGFLSQEQAEEFLQHAKENGYRISQKLIDEMFENLKERTK